MNSTPLFKAFFLGIFKMLSLYLLLILFVTCAWKDSSGGRIGRRTLGGVAFLAFVVFKDEAHIWEYGVENLLLLLLLCLSYVISVLLRPSVSLPSCFLRTLLLALSTTIILSPLDNLAYSNYLIENAHVDPDTVASFKSFLQSITTSGSSNSPNYCTNGILNSGLYASNSPYSSSNKLAHYWSQSAYLDYDNHPDRTRWLFTGDSRTLVPFIANAGAVRPVSYTRRWVNVSKSPDTVTRSPDQAEPYVAVDCIDRGTDTTLLVLHGLNGGSDEEYVKDLVGKTELSACVMIGRGLMNTPVVDGRMFNGARTGDVGIVAKEIKDATGGGKVVGVGFSMGAIVLSNYIAKAGEGCSLDAGISVGGGLDMTRNEGYVRSKVLWQPFLATTLVAQFFHRFMPFYEGRLTEEQQRGAEYATSVTDFDRELVAPYNGYGSVMDYYSAMSAGEGWRGRDDPGKIGGVSVPLAVVNALDDPIVCEGTMMEPGEVVEAGGKNIVYLLTKRGGHVGYPLGRVRGEGWRWMTETIEGFVEAVEAVTAEAN
ncbi:hypothetical protein TrCOL_g5590 [Triparma columacea]|uniref:AB hydrolase-1 domain-containing protein n=1 Tax=Triparma columacea TaxID=722753 RepID=A0A9W7FZL8_9STRA|nr:hypothetical protein TrCOL_g5590 [Triparma columacea]